MSNPDGNWLLRKTPNTMTLVAILDSKHVIFLPLAKLKGHSSDGVGPNNSRPEA
jgi:hypothetical protein